MITKILNLYFIYLTLCLLLIVLFVFIYLLVSETLSIYLTSFFLDNANPLILSSLNFKHNEETNLFTFAQKDIHTILNPHWVTGITDAEGNFYISIYKDSRRNGKENVRFFYKVSQRDYSQSILHGLVKFYNCGSVFVEDRNDKTMRFVVSDIKNIKTKIIPHFENYPLITSKKLNFYNFKKAFEIYQKGEHITLEGLSIIKNLKNEMNKGRSFEDKFYSVRAELNKEITINPSWFLGFSDGEGNFGVYLKARKRKKNDNVIEISVKTNFNISQNIHDIAILNAIKIFFNKGFIQPKLLDLTDLEEIKLKDKKAASYINNHTSSIISFFLNYPLLTLKQLDFLDFKKIVELKESKAHLTKEGFEKMLKIASHMNSGRFGLSKRKKFILPEWNKNTKVIII